MVPILAAFQFLTIFPALIKRILTPQEMGRAVAWFPLVGGALGLTLAGIHSALGLVFPSVVTAVLTLFAWVALTRAFHLDGFMDACDGIFGGFTPARRLDIMKDSRMGAFGTLGGILVLMTEFASLSSIQNLLPAILLATTLARWVAPLVIFAFPYARPEGLGFEMKRNVTMRELLIASLIAGILAWWVFSWQGLLLMAAAALLAFLLSAYVMRLLPGFTGDIYGMVITSVEMAVLLVFTLQ